MNRKGVTPVIATVLLITISIAATGTAYTFIMNAQQSAKDSYEDRFTQKEIERKTDLNIEHVYENAYGDAILVVRNTGSLTQIVEEEDNKFWNVYVDGRPVGTDGTSWGYIDSSYKSSANVDLNPQATMAINTTEPFPTATTREKQFRVSGKYGSRDTIICSYSSSGTC